MKSPSLPPDQDSRKVAETPWIAIVEHVDGVGDIPVISTADLSIQRLVSNIKRVAREISRTAHNGQNDETSLQGESRAGERRPFLLEFVDEESAGEQMPPKKISRKNAPKDCALIAQYFQGKGIRHLDLVPRKILSIDEVYQKLLLLPEERLTFVSVVEILFQRWYRRGIIYFNDRSVATLVSFLLDPSKRKKALDLLKSFESGANEPYFGFGTRR